MGCQHLDELYELYILGALQGAESLQIREHLERNCPHCLDRLREAAQTVYLLILLARPARFDMKRKGRLLQQLRGK